jgi:hypothetical protein
MRRKIVHYQGFFRGGTHGIFTIDVRLYDGNEVGISEGGNLEVKLFTKSIDNKRFDTKQIASILLLSPLYRTMRPGAIPTNHPWQSLEVKFDGYEILQKWPFPYNKMYNHPPDSRMQKVLDMVQFAREKFESQKTVK